MEPNPAIARVRIRVGVASDGSWEIWRYHMSHVTSPATARVRIRVGVASDGSWAAFGQSTQDDNETREWFNDDDQSPPFQYYWVMADMPIPTEITVEGDIIPDDGDQ